MGIPAFPLQVLLRRRPDWAGLPVAVVDRDEPQGLVLQVNEAARARRVLPGHRFAAALALATDLRADVVPGDEVRRAVEETVARLRRFTPGIEPSYDEPGVLWLEAGGLALLYPDLRTWAAAVRADLAAVGFAACIAVGFTRFGTYAVARALAARLREPAGTARDPPAALLPATAIVFRDETAEHTALRRVPLDRLGIEPGVRDLLAKLGVRTVADFLSLPAKGLGERFGETVRRLHRLASGEIRDPLAPEPPRDPVRVSVGLEHPESDSVRLLFIAKRLLDLALRVSAERREAVSGVELRLALEDGSQRTDLLRPAAPTLDAAQLLDLLRLRLESMQTEAAVRAALRPTDRFPRHVAGPAPGCGDAGSPGPARTFGATSRPGQEPPALDPAPPAPTPDPGGTALPGDGGQRTSPHPPPAQPPGTPCPDHVAAALPGDGGVRTFPRPDCGAVDVALVLHGVPAEATQLALFTETPKRDLAAADRALARLRAEFGEDAVVHARLRDAHLPEASYSWEPAGKTRTPRTLPAGRATAAPAVLVRRLLARPVPLPPRPRHEPDGWLLRGLEHGSVVRLDGPFLVSGGWWSGAEVRREYHFAETSKGRIYWIFYDVRRRRWFLQGEVS